MAEENQAQESQEGAEGQAQEAAANEQDSSQEQGTSEADKEADKSPQNVDQLPDWAKNLVKDLRKENASYRTEQKKRDDASKSEVERLTEDNETKQERISTLERKLRRSTFNERINLPNAKRAWAIAHDEGIEIEFDEDDQPTNLDAVRKALREADPALFGDGSADAGGGTGARGNGYQGNPGVGRITHAYTNKAS